MSGFLEMSGENFDFVCITGDAYVDHPSFGIAIISRVIESLGFRVGVISQPKTDADYKACGVPKYGFMVTSGNIDSMICNYTSSKKKRFDDAYSDMGKAGARPDRALTVYCNNIRRIFDTQKENVNIVIGGIEASLRRFAHYDYWADKVFPSILADTKADLLLFGMAENSVSEVCGRLGNGEKISEIRGVLGTCYLCDPRDVQGLYQNGVVETASFEQLSAPSPEGKKKYAEATRKQYDNQDEVYGKTIIQRHGKLILVQNPPPKALSQAELDRVYGLPFTRKAHPKYKNVPAIEEVKFSIAHNRGCIGFCNFCALALHQGRKITCRSKESVIKEAKSFIGDPDFKGYIHDVGGPTANFRLPACEKQLKNGLCKGRKCLAVTDGCNSSHCKNLTVDHSEYLDILRNMRNIKGVKRVFIRSGIRYDYLLLDKASVLRELAEHHVSGQLKVAPEHCSPAVLGKMGKPRIETFLEFRKRFAEASKAFGKEQYLVPYFMSSHPGSTLNDAIELALFLKKNKIRPEQVQDFYPTPGTVSTCMYYTELDPYTMERVFVPKSADEKAMQRALLQYYEPRNRELVKKALRLAKRADIANLL